MWKMWNKKTTEALEVIKINEFKNCFKQWKKNISISVLNQTESMELEKTPAFGLPVTTKPNKQWQWLNLYGLFIQMAGDLRRWRVHTLTDNLPFSFQARLFIIRNRQGVRGLWDSGTIRWKKLQHSCPGQLAVPRGPWSSVCLSHPGTQRPGCLQLSPGSK